MLSWLQNPLHAVEEFISISTSLSKEGDLNCLLDKLLSGARRLTGADGGIIYILDNTKRNLHVKVCQCDSSIFKANDFSTVPLYINGQRNIGEVCTYCAFTGKTLNTENVYRYSGFNIDKFYELDRRLRYKTKSLLTVPMRNNDNYTLGILQLVNMIDKQAGEIVSFPQELEGLVRAFASQGAVALDNARLIKKNQELINLLNINNRKLSEENELLRKKIQGNYDFSRIVGSSPAMQKVFDLMSKVLESDATVLIRGDTGTGKELIANAIHYNSSRYKAEFVAQNCAALPEQLLESELFGYRKGAFSGAYTDKSGLIEQAHKGTLFLDEIGDMPLGLQAKLLRVLQEKEVRPLGSTESRKVNVRIVAATHCNLEKKIEDGEFREDLFYRLSVFPIDIPPLRERREDLPALLAHFMENFSTLYEKEIAGIAPQALDILSLYDYPGNIRELRNILERAVLLCVGKGNILPEHLPPEILNSPTIQSNLKPKKLIVDTGSLKDLTEEFEAEAIRQTLEGNGWNQTKTAAALGIGRRTLITKINRYQIERSSRVN